MVSGDKNEDAEEKKKNPQKRKCDLCYPPKKIRHDDRAPPLMYE